MDEQKIQKKSSPDWRTLFIILCIAFMVFAIFKMLAPSPKAAHNGKVTLSGEDLVSLDGDWEFYWGQLLTPEDFVGGNTPQVDSLMKVPDSWDSNAAYPNQGVATYRLIIDFPASLKDPALRISNIASAYKLYANGQLITEVGTVSKSPSHFKEKEQSLIVALPNDTQELELIFQVANLNYFKGGIRESPMFGSKQVLAQQKTALLSLQLLFIGSILIFGVYYLLLFLLQTKNKTALYFSLLCFITALRSLIWGEQPIQIFFPTATYDARLLINYLTGYNLIPCFIMFVLSIYPKEYKKTVLGFVLLPTIIFDVLLLLKSHEFMSSLTSYIYILVLLQMICIICILIKAVLRKRDNAKLMYIATCVFVLAILQDILHYKGIGGINASNMFLYGNLVVIIAMSYVQAKQQALTQKKLVFYNENLIEADKLKDKIMETEMSFLQAQIKPHFLYNALNAIANVCEKDGKQAGKLIIDLALYLRGSLEFNNLEKMATIEKELQFVDTYFHIEQARFGEKIQLQKEIDIPLDYQIPVLILQPLVENAVRHGISKKLGGGTVFVRMKMLNEGAYIEIEDDGVGIDSEKLATLLKEDEAINGIGLRNINNRLLKIYGRGLDISSEEGRTIVKITIPEERNAYDKNSGSRR
ncbi:MAG: histidine kinase [Firmicutes bacterium HGW-Firmicutes-16]|nr:MAG: histidine kinase [Firmicutes bacterium HGW-Firmicutes-16]